MQSGWKTFPTVLGVCGVGWNAAGVTHFCLPESDGVAIARRLGERTGSRNEAKVLPDYIRRLLVAVKAHMKGDAQDFSGVQLVLADASDFVQSVYRTACQIPSGSVLTYAELAAALGKPGAARAVGGALGKNPIPLLIPCHRIVAAGGKPGGFTAPGGLGAKMALLECEGVALKKPVLISTPAQWRKAVTHLQSDKKMAALIERVGPIHFKPHNRDEPLTSLIGAIVSQQLSVKAAATIQKRVDAIIHVDGVVHPEKLLRTSDDELRAAGLSYMKVSFLKDLAQKYLDGELPTMAELQNLSNEQIIKRFTHVKGVGRWTVEMYLIFNLGRADVWPVDDLGVRKGLALFYKLPETPGADLAKNYGDTWSPYRSVAALYLWRSLDNA